MHFTKTYRKYARNVLKDDDTYFSLKTVAWIEPFISFLYRDWWKVDFTGFKHLPADGPALVVGNAGGVLPWPGLMLLYALMRDRARPRRLTILCDMDWIEDERIYSFLREIGFVPWSADHAKKAFEQGQIVAVFPEGPSGAVKPFGERYRLRRFDWTRIMPAIEQQVPILPLATLGCDESFPVGMNLERLAHFLSLPAFPLTPFFPWYPFPANVTMSLPVKWKMRLLKPVDYKRQDTRDALEDTSDRLALFLEGEVQAELNRLLRTRIKPLF